MGSRSIEKAEETVSTILREKPGKDYLQENLRSAENRNVVESCKIIFLTVPHENAIETIRSLVSNFLGGQILISAVAPVVKVGKEFHSKFDSSGKSVSQQIAELIPKSIKVATAFQSVPAHILYEERPISADVLVACDELETYRIVSELISKIEGLRPLYLGTLDLSGEIERLTALVLNIAIKNKLKSPTPKFNSF